MRREKIFGLLILAMMLMFQTSLMAQTSESFVAHGYSVSTDSI